MGKPFSVDDTVEKHPLQVQIVPEIYIKSNQSQRAMGIQTLNALHESFGIKPNASQQFLDVGCGTGDFTRQELLPRCQPCRRIVATDISRAMVEYAEENFAHPQIAYEVHDIEGDISGLVRKYGKFDRVYSFFVLHWAEDLTAALRNVAALMTAQGECMLVFAAQLAMYRVWKRIVEMDRWKPYKGVIERFIPPSQDIEGRSGLYSYMLAVLQKANLKPRTFQLLTRDESGMDVDKFIQVELSIDPILPLLPEGSRREFEADVADIVRRFWTEKPAGDPQYLLHVFVVHASKVFKKKVQRSLCSTCCVQ
ncbi:juvenile hormone acid O-methyltransferase-like isoform X1 [Ixodes scapularis]|uniref:juvenile hormone acid O-methyltransferase-like isoform X1 n=2 Tax=Ixodes scapularis TaxID=6945 RepID=UPI001A9F75D0|nr:juvenile hormone acid O-methyltransferase-like isoform X1 [Ixodes scapularis]